MQQIFVTPDSIYAQLWDLARKPKDGQDVESHWKEMVAQQVHWAMLIQACAPGSSVSQVSLLTRHSLRHASPIFPRHRCLDDLPLLTIFCVSCCRSS